MAWAELANMKNLNQLVNKIGKYLKKHIDSAYKFKVSSNMCDVYMTVFYQVPILPDTPSGKVTYSDMHEMDIDINITTYSDKIRINVTEISPNEATIGYMRYDAEFFDDMILATKRILIDITTRLEIRYKDYQFIY